MDSSMTKLRAALILATGAMLVTGCSRGDVNPAATEAADAPAPPTAAAPSDISIPGTGIFPESLTSSSDGSVFIGSVGKAQIYRVPPGTSTAEVFIQPGTGGMKQVFGVFADGATPDGWARLSVDPWHLDVGFFDYSQDQSDAWPVDGEDDVYHVTVYDDRKENLGSCRVESDDAEDVYRVRLWGL